MFQIDPLSRTPVYAQIIAQTERFILTGALPPESQIPSVRNLSVTHSINPRTILKAYNELDSRGLIQAVPGKGYFVCRDACEKLQQEERRKLQDLLRLLDELILAGITETEISACVAQAFEKKKGETSK
ncbi:MAG: GntR family transcriptional regulator [Ruminococcus sp.]|nr:GntR family transcriptional regulator [Ruminococcus sp.]